MSVDSKLKLIADHFGLERQLSKLQEELAELIGAIAKRNIIEDAGSIRDIAEEIADVEIVLDQVKYLASQEGWEYICELDLRHKGFITGIEDFKAFKLARTLERYEIGGWKND